MPNDISQYRAAIGVFDLTRRKTKKNYYNIGGTDFTSDFKDGCHILGHSIFSIIYLVSICWNLSFFMITNLYLLSQCTDVHPHPGPDGTFANITFCHINIRSINTENRLDAFLDQLTDRFDIITCSETWLSKKDLDKKYEIPGYTGPYRMDRTLQGGGGSWLGLLIR